MFHVTFKRPVALFVLSSLLFFARAASAQIRSGTVTPNQLPPAGGTVTVQAVLDAAFPVSGVSAMRDGYNIGPLSFTGTNADGTKNYAASFNIGANLTLQTQTYAFAIRATDTTNHTVTGAAGTARVAAAPPITIQNPAVSVQSLPAAGGAITVSCRAFPGGYNTISYIGVYRNGSNMGTLTYKPNAAPDAPNYVGTFSLPANVNNTPAPHLLTLRANDNAGNVTPALVGTVTVGAVTPVSIVAAAVSTNALDAAGGRLTVTAQVTAPAPNSVTSVSAYRNSGSMGALNFVSTNADGSANYAGTFDIPANITDAPASYALTLRVGDYAGSVTAKSLGSLTVGAIVPVRIVSATASTDTLDATGGSVTINAKIRVAAPNAVNSLYAVKNGNNLGSLTYVDDNADGTKNYVGTFAVGANTTNSPVTSLLTIHATDSASNHAYLPAGTLTVGANAPVQFWSAGAGDSLPASGGDIPVNAIVYAPAPNDISSVIVMRNGGNSATLHYVSANDNGSKNYVGTLSLPAATGGVAVKYAITFRATDNLGNSVYQSGGVVTVGTGAVGTPIQIISASFDRNLLPPEGGDVIVHAKVRVTSPNRVYTLTIYRNGGYAGNLTCQSANADGTLNYSGSYNFTTNTTNFSRLEDFRLLATDTASNMDAMDIGLVSQYGVQPLSVNAVTMSATDFPATGGSLLVTANVTVPYPNDIYNVTLYGNGSYIGSMIYLYDNPDGSSNYIISTPVSANNRSIARNDLYAVAATDNAGHTVFTPVGMTTVGVNAPITIVSAALSASSVPAVGGHVAINATVRVASPNAVSTLTAYASGQYAAALNFLNFNADGTANYVGSMNIGVNRSEFARIELVTLNATDTAGNAAFAAPGAIRVAESAPIRIVNAAVSTTTLPASGGDVLVTATLAAPSPNAVSNVIVNANGPYFGTLTYQNANPDGSVNYAGSFTVPANAGVNSTTYLFTLVASDYAGNTVSSVIGSLNAGSAQASVSGKITLEGEVATAPAQKVIFAFHPDDDSGDFTQSVSIGPDGLYILSSLPRKNYAVRIKSPKNLAQTVSADARDGDVNDVNALLPGGDATNDNSVDVADFGALINAFGSVNYDANTGYDPAADFNGDGSVDVGDFGILINNFGSVGDR